MPPPRMVLSGRSRRRRRGRRLGSTYAVDSFEPLRSRTVATVAADVAAGLPMANCDASVVAGCQCRGPAPPLMATGTESVLEMPIEELKKLGRAGDR